MYNSQSPLYSKKLKSKNLNSFEGTTYDRVFLSALLIFLALGLIIVYDVSVVFAYEVFSNKYHFLKLQALWMFIGLISFYIAYKTDYRVLSRYSFPLFLISFIFLILVLLPTPFSPEIYGARRWLFLNPEPLPLIPFLGRQGFQPSELVKLPFILYLATLLTSANKKREQPLYVVFAMLLGSLVLLIMKQPDFGTTLSICLVGITMYFVHGADKKHFIYGLPLAILIASMFILLSPYRRERLFTYLSPSEQHSATSGYHINQIMIALGSGGVFGKGIGQSRQKYLYIPEVVTDSIFPVVGEELGFIGSIFIVSGLVFIIYRGFKIALGVEDPLGKLIATGIVTWFASQCYINLSGMVHLIPLTGVPLPLISYGGSATVFGLFSLGVLLNISKHSKDA